MTLKKLFSRKAKPLSSVALSNSTDSVNGCFDCNICLDFVRDPVVTLCGHLYCWPCIYKWFNVQSATLGSVGQPQCPVCKAEISVATVVPLYGRGETPSHSGNTRGTQAPSIPPRPPACGTRALMSAPPRHTHELPFPGPYPEGGRQQYYAPYEQTHSAPLTQAGSLSANVVHPVLEMFVEMIYARAFGNSSRSLYTLQNTYHNAMNPRVRRQEMQTFKSLNRMSIFFFCCILLCLFLF